MGRTGVTIGSVLIGVRNARSRCVMTTFDPDTLEQDLSVLRRVVDEFDGCLALDCWVVEPGRIEVGDPVSVVELASGLTPGAGETARYSARAAP